MVDTYDSTGDWILVECLFSRNGIEYVQYITQGGFGQRYIEPVTSFVAYYGRSG